MTIKLKPCPFCGSNDLRIYRTPGRSGIWCFNCGFRIPDKETMEAWNAKTHAWEKTEGEIKCRDSQTLE